MAAAVRTSAAALRRRVFRSAASMSSPLAHPEAGASSGGPPLSRSYHNWESLLKFPPGCQQAPVAQLSFNNAADWANENFMWLDDFPEKFPLFGLIEDNPLIMDKDAWEFLQAGKFVLGSMLGIAAHNHGLGLSIAPSLFEGNIVVSPHFMQVWFLNPIGIPLDEQNGITKELTYSSIADLFWKFVRRHYPHVKFPKEFHHLMSKLRSKLKYPEAEELLVFNPCLMEDQGLVSYLQHSDNLMRKLFDSSKDPEERATSWQVFKAVSKLRGPDGSISCIFQQHIQLQPWVRPNDRCCKNTIWVSSAWAC